MRLLDWKKAEPTNPEWSECLNFSRPNPARMRELEWQSLQVTEPWNPFEVSYSSEPPPLFFPGNSISLPSNSDDAYILPGGMFSGHVCPDGGYTWTRNIICNGMIQTRYGLREEGIDGGKEVKTNGSRQQRAKRQKPTSTGKRKAACYSSGVLTDSVWSMLVDDGIDMCLRPAKKMLVTKDKLVNDVVCDEWTSVDAFSPYWGGGSSKERVREYVEETRYTLGDVRRRVLVISGSRVWNSLVCKIMLSNQTIVGDAAVDAAMDAAVDAAVSEDRDGVFAACMSIYTDAVRAWDRMTYVVAVSNKGLDFNSMHIRFLACMFWSLRSQSLAHPGGAAEALIGARLETLSSMESFIAFAAGVHPANKDAELHGRFETRAFKQACKLVWENNGCQSPGSFLSILHVARGVVDERMDKAEMYKVCMPMMLCVMWSDMPFQWSQMDLGVAVLLATWIARDINMPARDEKWRDSPVMSILEHVSNGDAQKECVLWSLAREILCMHEEMSSRLPMPFMAGGKGLDEML